MDNCSFTHAGQAEKDVVIDGTKDTRIYLKNTVVATNQAIGSQTNKALCRLLTKIFAISLLKNDGILTGNTKG